MILNQILSLAAAFLQICKCQLQSTTKLYDIGLYDEKLNHFKIIIQHQYGITINNNETKNWINFLDISKTIENKIKSLF